MTALELPAAQSVSSSTIRAEANRATVHRAMDAIRASGTPGSQAQLMAETGLSYGTISRYAGAYIREVNAELLGREVDDEAAFQAWTALYRSFAVYIRASPDGRSVRPAPRGPDLKHTVGTAGRPTHLLALVRAGTHQLVDGALGP